MDIISARFIGKPYQSNPLTGSAETLEVFTGSTRGFDCVTYVEAVLALAQSADRAGFLDRLRRIRYADGKVEWQRRNHYMTEWIRNNVRAGIVRRIPGLPATVSKTRMLDAVPGLAARRMKFACVPKADVLRHAGKLQTGDLMFFASTRKRLDVFHCGIVVNDAAGLRLRHASQRRARVVEEKLAAFLKGNRMAGVLVVRPA